MHWAICNEIFKEWPLEKAFPFIAKTGYQGVEIAPFTLAPLITDIPATRRREIRHRAEDAGLVVTGIHWVLAFTEGMHVNHPDPASRQRAADYLQHAVDFCADLGGTCPG